MNLSIIMPCYNCEKTLKEAVDSIYTQNLIMPFEIVMVDDGSSDGTRELIKNLANKYKEIKYLFHEQNRGGGATRNSAVENSSGEVIFCLDSDDVLGDKVLNNMYKQLIDDNLDGITFEERRYFYGNDLTKYDIHKYNNSNLEIEVLFSKKENPLIANFLYTKESFYKVGGYPIYHGFDTQGYGYKWLAIGNKAGISKGTFYYHRQKPIGKKSYFEREFEKGKISEYYYFIMEEIFYLLSDELKEFILKFDTKKFIDLDESLSHQIQNKFEINNIFNKDYKHYLNTEFENIIKKDKYYYYWKGAKNYRKKEYEIALFSFIQAKKEIDYSIYLDYYIVSSFIKLNDYSDLTVNSFLDNLKEFTNKNTNGYVGNRQTFFQRIKNKIRKIKG